MTEAGRYSLDEIHYFLENERFVRQGISPDVGKQNELIAKVIGIVAKTDPDVAAVHMLGSRTHGTSDLESDIDIAVVRFGANKRDSGHKVAGGLRGLLPGMSIDPHSAAATCRLGLVIPDTVDELGHLVRSRPYNLASLMEEGVYTTPQLHLGRLAAMGILATVRRRGSRDSLWSEVQNAHSWAFLGRASHICEKLTARLGLASKTPEQVLPGRVMEERIRKFRLPGFDASYDAARAWFEVHGDEEQVVTSPAYQLYESVSKRA